MTTKRKRTTKPSKRTARKAGEVTIDYNGARVPGRWFDDGSISPLFATNIDIGGLMPLDTLADWGREGRQGDAIYAAIQGGYKLGHWLHRASYPDVTESPPTVANQAGPVTGPYLIPSVDFSALAERVGKLEADRAHSSEITKLRQWVGEACDAVADLKRRHEQLDAMVQAIAAPKPEQPEAPAIPEPECPPGYEFCARDEADRNDIGWAWGFVLRGEWTGPLWLRSFHADSHCRFLRRKRTTPEAPQVVIPLGYEKVATREEADKDKAGNSACLVGYGDGAYVFGYRLGENSGARYIWLRCTLPPEIAKFWQPAPGATHEEQRRNAYPLGNGNHAFIKPDGKWVIRLDPDDLYPTDIPLVPRKAVG